MDKAAIGALDGNRQYASCHTHKFRITQCKPANDCRSLPVRDARASKVTTISPAFR